MVHIHGVKHLATDALSRYPTGTTHPAKMHLGDDISSAAHQTDARHTFLDGIRNTETHHAEVDSTAIMTATSSLSALQSVTWERVRTATASDENMNQLIDIVESGMPDSRDELPPALQEYHQFREYLSTVDGVVVYKDRVLVPPSLRQDCLTALHAAHQGTSSMIARAESSIFWPGITPDITATRNRCSHCNRMAPSQPSAPPAPLIRPAYPFQCICADYFHHSGYNYLVIVDRYSNWPIVERNTGGSKNLIESLRRSFVTYGIPDELSSDGGPEFTATATTNFLKTWGVHHRLSSTAFPHSNCRAEVGVKTVKRMITDNIGPRGELDTDKFQRAVLQYRNCPHSDAHPSPAMCLFGRPIRDFIPILPGRYQAHSTWKETAKAREEALRIRHIKDAERWSEHTKTLPPLRVGDYVRMQNQTGRFPLKWEKTGLVIEVKQHDQYVIRVDGSGRVTIRNRKFLRQYTPAMPPENRLTIANDLRTHGHGTHTPPPELPLQEDTESPPEEDLTESTTPTFRRPGLTNRTSEPMRTRSKPHWQTMGEFDMS